MVGRGQQIKPIKSIRTEDGKYKYSAEQKAARNAKDRARRLKLKIKGLEDANNELKKANTVLSKAVARQEKKVQASKDAVSVVSKRKKAPKGVAKEDISINAIERESGIDGDSAQFAKVKKALKVCRESQQ